MTNRLAMLVISMLVTLMTTSGQVALARPISSGVAVPLVLVNGDTITEYDLRLELDIMKKMNPDAGETRFADAGKVLRRLIQNQLILQEGYRMEMEKDYSVSNQVRELVRSRGVVALLDSVALSVPSDTPDLTDARRNAVDAYVDGLMKSHHVSIDSTLLQSLDYASSDAEVQKHLSESKDVLAVIPTSELTVARFTRVLRFKEFHGLVGKTDAVPRRDKAFREWIIEAVLSYQAKIQRLGQSPAVLEDARNLERILVRQETIKALLESSYEPQPDEIKQFYEENIAGFMSPSRVKMKSKKLNTEAAAKAFREKLIAGATIEWLAENDPEIVPGADPFPYDWFLPEKLGLKSEELEAGFVPQPYGVPGGWVVAVVSEIEKPIPLPLDDCRARIIPQLKSRSRQKAMADIMVRLEEASEIRILPGADDVVQGVLEEMN